MLQSGKPRVLLSSQEGPRLGEWIRTADKKAVQSREGLTWLGRNCGSRPVEGGHGGWVFSMIALEKKVRRRVCSSTERNRGQDLSGVFTEPPKETVKNTGASETNGPGSKSRIYHLLSVWLGASFFGLFKLQLPPL